MMGLLARAMWGWMSKMKRTKMPCSFADPARPKSSEGVGLLWHSVDRSAYEIRLALKVTRAKCFLLDELRKQFGTTWTGEQISAVIDAKSDKGLVVFSSMMQMVVGLALARCRQVDFEVHLHAINHFPSSMMTSSGALDANIQHWRSACSTKMPHV